MTTFDDVLTAFSALSFLVRPDHVPIGTEVPFGEYTFRPVNFSADGKVYHSGYQFTLSVYMDKLSDAILTEVTGALDDLGVVWQQDEPIYISDSEIYEIDFNFGI